MAENTAIEWTDATFNPWIGCTKVHEGCRHCYAEADMDHRRGRARWGPQGTRSVTSEDYWMKPLKKWNRQAILKCVECGNKYTTEAAPKGATPVDHPWEFECCCGCNNYESARPRVFCASLADVFEDWEGPMCDHEGRHLVHTPVGWHAEDCEELESASRVTMADVRRRLFALIDDTPHLDWILLTKRPENIRRMWPMPINGHDYGSWEQINRNNALRRAYGGSVPRFSDDVGTRPNVWLLTSVSDQESADKQIPELLKCRDLSPVLGVSAEPLLGPIQMQPHIDPVTGNVKLSHGVDLDWVIVGGESGHKARPMHPDWVRTIRDQCQAAGVPFFFKQWGEWAPLHGTGRPRQDEEEEVSPFTWVDPHTGRCATSGCEPEAVMIRSGKKVAGRLLDGREWSEFPKT